MRIVIWLALLIVFISAFFIFFILDVVIKRSLTCLFSLTDICDYNRIGSAFTTGLVFISLFILVDIIMFYVIKITTETEPFAL